MSMGYIDSWVVGARINCLPEQESVMHLLSTPLSDLSITLSVIAGNCWNLVTRIISVCHCFGNCVQRHLF